MDEIKDGAVAKRLALLDPPPDSLVLELMRPDGDGDGEEVLREVVDHEEPIRSFGRDRCETPR